MAHLTAQELEAGLADVRLAPKDGGRVEMIVRRPAIGAREVIDEGEIDLAAGLRGDTWSERPSSRMSTRTPHPDMQITLVNARAIQLVAGGRERWPLAGDQLFVDLDVSEENLPPGTRLAIGDAVVEVTAQPHTGCAKFRAHFGADATTFVNSPVGRSLNLRGINARVVAAGRVRTGDTARKAR